MTTAEASDGPHHEHDALEEAFFSRPPPPVVHDVEHPEDWGPPPPMGRTERSVMLVTSAMVGAAVLALGGFAVFGDQLARRRTAPVAVPTSSQVLAAISESRPTGPLPTVSHAAALPSPEEAAAPNPVAQAPEAIEAAEVPATAEPAAEPTLEPELAAAQAAQAGAAATAAPAPAGRAPARPAAARRARAARAHSAAAAGANANPEVRRLIQSARRDFDRGDASSAQRKALDAISLAPEQGYAYVLLGAARDAVGNHAGAQAAYRLCIQQAKDRHVAACRTLAR